MNNWKTIVNYEAPAGELAVSSLVAEIGIPVHETGDQPEAVVEWWQQNREKTKADRDASRLQIGLPPSDPGK